MYKTKRSYQMKNYIKNLSDEELIKLKKSFNLTSYELKLYLNDTNIWFERFIAERDNAYKDDNYFRN